MCVVLTAGKPTLVDQTAVDKEAVLTTLNIRGMFEEHLEQQIKSLDSEYRGMASLRHQNCAQPAAAAAAAAAVTTVTATATETTTRETTTMMK